MDHQTESILKEDSVFFLPVWGLPDPKKCHEKFNGEGYCESFNLNY